MGKQKSRLEEQDLRQSMMGKLASQRTREMFGLSSDTRAFHNAPVESGSTTEPNEDNELNRAINTNKVLERFRQDKALNLERKAENQSSWSQLGNSLVKMFTKAATTTAVTAGSLLGFGDELAEWATDVDKQAEKEFPNYRSQEELETPWYKRMVTPKYMANFWGDDVLKNAGFTLGAVWGARFATMPLRVAEKKALQSISRDAARLIETSQDKAATENAITTILRANRPVQAAAQLNRYVNTQKAYTFAEELLGSMAASFGEASIEAKSVYNEFVDSNNKKLSDYLQKNMSSLYNEYSSSKELQSKYKTFDEYVDSKVNGSLGDIIKLANGAASTTFSLNLPILMTENLLVWRKMFSGGFKNLSMAKSELGLERNIRTATGAGNSIIAKNNYSIAKRIAEIGKRPIYEGGQEMLQAVASTGSKYYFGSKLNDYLGFQLNDEYNDKAVNWFKAMGRGFSETFLNEDAWLEGFVGALTTMVGIPSIHITGRVTNKNGRKKVLPFSLKMEGSLRNAVKATNAKYNKIQEIVDLINTNLGSEENVRDYTQFVRQIALNDNMKDALITMDKLKYKDNEHMSLFSLATHLYDVGRIDDFNKLLDKAADVSKEEYDNLVQEIKASSEEAIVTLDYDAFKKEIQDLKNIITESLDIKQKVDEKFRGTVNDDLLNFLASSLSLAKNKIDRSKSILESHSKVLGNSKIAITPETNINELIAQIGQVLFGEKFNSEMKDLDSLKNEEVLDNLKKNIKRTNSLLPNELDELARDLADVLNNLIDYQEYTNAYTYGMYNPDKIGELYKQIVRQRFNQQTKQKEEAVKDKIKTADSAESLNDAVETAGEEEAAAGMQEANEEIVKEWKDIKAARKAIRQTFKQIYDESNDNSLVGKLVKDGTIPQEEAAKISDIINTGLETFENTNSINAINTSMSKVSNFLIQFGRNLVFSKNPENAAEVDAKVAKIQVLIRDVEQIFKGSDDGTVKGLANSISEAHSLFSTKQTKPINERKADISKSTDIMEQFLNKHRKFLLGEFLDFFADSDVDKLYDKDGNVIGLQSTNKYKSGLVIIAKVNLSEGRLLLDLSYNGFNYSYMVDDFAFYYTIGNDDEDLNTEFIESDTAIENLFNELNQALEKLIKNTSDEVRKNKLVDLNKAVSIAKKIKSIDLPLTDIIIYNKIAAIPPYAETSDGNIEPTIAGKINNFVKDYGDFIETNHLNTEKPESQQPQEKSNEEPSEETGEEGGQDESVDEETTEEVEIEWPKTVYNTQVTEADIQQKNDSIVTRHTKSTDRTNSDKTEEEIAIIDRIRKYADGHGMYKFINSGKLQKNNLLNDTIFFEDIEDDLGVPCIGAYVNTYNGENQQEASKPQLIGIFRLDTPTGKFIASLGKNDTGRYNAFSSIEEFKYGSEQFSLAFEKDESYAMIPLNNTQDISEALRNGDVAFFFKNTKGEIVSSKANTLVTEKVRNLDRDSLKVGAVYMLMPKVSNYIKLDENGKQGDSFYKPYIIQVSALGYNDREGLDASFYESEFGKALDKKSELAKKITISRITGKIVSNLEDTVNDLFTFTENASSILANTNIKIDYDKVNKTVTVKALYSRKENGEKIEGVVEREGEEMSMTIDLNNPDNSFEDSFNTFLEKLNPMFRIDHNVLDNIQSFIQAGLLLSPVKDQVYPFNTSFTLTKPKAYETAQPTPKEIDSDSEETTKRKPVTPTKVKKKEGTDPKEVTDEDSEDEGNENSEILNTLNDIRALLEDGAFSSDAELIDAISKYSALTPNILSDKLKDKKQAKELNKKVLEFKKPSNKEAIKAVRDCFTK